MRDIEKTIGEAKAEVLPYESWERLTGESPRAYSAFCFYRDYGPERNIRRAVEGVCAVGCRVEKQYRMWRVWATHYRWRERAADYDQYLDRLKQTEKRKTIEAQGERHRAITGKMLTVVEKKLDMMNPADLSQGTVKDWVETAIRAERDAAGLVVPNNGKAEPKQGEINFTPEFEGL
jgi:hypothetical protein